MIPIPEERQVQFGTSCHCFAIKALPNWTEPEFETIYNFLGARPEDMADAISDSGGPACLPQLWVCANSLNSL